MLLQVGAGVWDVCECHTRFGFYCYSSLHATRSGEAFNSRQNHGEWERRASEMKLNLYRAGQVSLRIVV